MIAANSFAGAASGSIQGLLWMSNAAGLPVNVSQGVCTAIVMFLFGRPILEKLDRVKIKYGMMEDADGI